jgi:DNA invertase Pin-like site-specific DNA recombinase
MIDQDPIAEHKAAKLEWRQGLERLALETGQKHAQHLDDLASSRQFIVEELIPKAAEAGISFDALAKLLGISRQTLYRWQEAVRLKREVEAGG